MVENGNGKGGRIRDWAAMITALGGILLGTLAYLREVRDPKAEAGHDDISNVVTNLSSDVRSAVIDIQENRQAISSLKIFFMGYTLGVRRNNPDSRKTGGKHTKVDHVEKSRSSLHTKQQNLAVTILRQLEVQKKLRSLKLPPQRKLKSWKNLRLQQKH